MQQELLVGLVHRAPQVRLGLLVLLVLLVQLVRQACRAALAKQGLLVPRAPLGPLVRLVAQDPRV